MMDYILEERKRSRNELINKFLKEALKFATSAIFVLVLKRFLPGGRYVGIAIAVVSLIAGEIIVEVFF